MNMPTAVTALDLTQLPRTPQQRRPPPACGPRDPSTWDTHVVRALCSRSSATLTLPCNTCSSVFLPCLCKPEERLAPQACVLSAPRVVRIAEQRRLVHDEQRRVLRKGHGRPLSCSVHRMGNLTEVLDSVQKEAETHSRDLTRLVVFSGSGEAAAANGRSVITGSCRATEVAWRDGDQYFLHPSTPQMYRQVLHLAEEELPEVDQRLSRRQDVGNVIWSKTVSVEYDKLPANGDLILEESRPGIWEVQSVKEGGIADVAKVRAGHRLLKILRPHERLRSCKDTESDAHVLQVPDCFKCTPTDEEALGGEDRHSDSVNFPCILCFDQLPFGWKREGQVCQLPDGMGVTFACSRMSCRHEFARERELAANALRDRDLWQDWVIGCGMSLSTMAVVAKKLADRSLQEMQEFERANHERLHRLFRKCEDLAGLRQLQQTYSQDQQEPQLQLQPAVWPQQQQQCRYRCRGQEQEQQQRQQRQQQQDVEVCRHVTQQRRQGLSSAGGLSEEHIVRDVAALLEVLPRSWVEALAAHGASPTSSMAEGTRQSSRMVNKAMHLLPHKLWGDVSKEAQQYLHDVKSATQRESDRFDPPREKMSSGAAKQGNGAQFMDLDGQLSLREFERTLILSGVQWLTRSHVFKLFSALDMDRTGKVSLEDVLYVTKRLLDLVREAWAYGELQESAGHVLSEAELIQEFGKALQERHRALSPRSPDQLRVSPQRTMNLTDASNDVVAGGVPRLAPLPSETADQLYELFKQCDVNGDGLINRRELIKACRASSNLANSLGLPHTVREGNTREVLERFFQQVDADSDNQLSWEEFKTALGHVSGDPNRSCASTGGKAEKAVTLM